MAILPAPTHIEYPTLLTYWLSLPDNVTYECDEQSGSFKGQVDVRCTDNGEFMSGFTFVCDRSGGMDCTADSACSHIPVVYCRKPLILYHTRIVKGTRVTELGDVCSTRSDDLVCSTHYIKSPPRITNDYMRSSNNTKLWLVSGNYVAPSMYQCNRFKDVLGKGNNYINALCTDGSTTYTAGHKSMFCSTPGQPVATYDHDAVSVHECSLNSCSDMEFALCEHGDIDVYDAVMNGQVTDLVLRRTCSRNVKGCSDTRGPTKPAQRPPERPPNSNSRYFYVYAEDYNSRSIFYDCSADDNRAEYLNILCDPDHEGVIDSKYAYTCGKGLDKVLYDEDESRIQDCSISTCPELSPSLCKQPVDIFQASIYGMEKVATCGLGTHGTCVRLPDITPDQRMIRPTQRLTRNVGWWFVGSSAYNTAGVGYACSDIDVIGGDYINVLCDSDFTSEIKKGLYITCTPPSDRSGITKPNCSAVTCEGLYPSLCQKDIDIYIGTPVEAQFVATCTLESGKCVIRDNPYIPPIVDTADAMTIVIVTMFIYLIAL